MTDNTITQLSITDLAKLKVIIDTACSRGAFQAAEMKEVGEVYDRLTNFLATIVAQAEQTQNKGETQ